MKRRLSTTLNDKNVLLSEFDKLFMNLLKQPSDIIQIILSYIPKYFMGLFSECEALLPFTLPYIKNHVVIGYMRHEDSDPLSWLKITSVEIDEPVLAMETLEQIMSKCDFQIKDASLSLVSQIQESITGSKCENYYLSHLLRPSEYAIRIWFKTSVDVLSRIGHLHFLNPINIDDLPFLIRTIKPAVDVGSVIVYTMTSSGKHYLEDDIYVEVDEDDPELNELPTTLTSLKIVSSAILEPQYFKRMTSLKDLELFIILVQDFRFLPPSLESLTVRSLLLSPTSGVPFLPNLKYLECKIDSEEHDLPEFISSLEKVETLKLRFYGREINERLRFPQSLRVLHLESQGKSQIYSGLIHLPNLQELSITGFFPRDLFDDENKLTKLRSFSYSDWNIDADNIELNFIKFPKNLKNLTLHGDISIKKWKLPQHLQSLSLESIKFEDRRLFPLPPTLSVCLIKSTNLKSIDNYQFPTGLTDLEIKGNKRLISMKNTNLKELTRLKCVNFLGNGVYYGFHCEPSNPTNESIRYEFNSFTL